MKPLYTHTQLLLQYGFLVYCSHTFLTILTFKLVSAYFTENKLYNLYLSPFELIMFFCT